MANRSVNLYLYAQLPGIGWRYCRAAFTSTGKLKPHVLIRRDGSEEHHPGADYHLGYRNGSCKRWDKIGSRPQEALDALELKRSELSYVAAGGRIERRGASPENADHLSDAGRLGRDKFTTAMSDWLQIIKEKFSADSYGAKKLVLSEFLQSFGKIESARLCRWFRQLERSSAGYQQRADD